MWQANKREQILMLAGCSVFFSTVLAACFSAPMLQADEPLPGGHFNLTGVEVVPIDRTIRNGKTIDTRSDKLTHWIRFDVMPKYSVVKGSESKNFQILNPILSAKSSMTLNKPIRFQGKRVPAGTNLLSFQKFDGTQFNVHMPDLFPLAIHSATIVRDFEIPADTYKVTFRWQTKSGQVISDTVKVWIDVKLPGP